MERPYVLIWISANERDTKWLGSFISIEAAEFAKPAALQRLLDGCANDDDRDRIRCGGFIIERIG